MIYSDFEKEFKKQSITTKFLKFRIVIYLILYFGLLNLSYLFSQMNYPLINFSVYFVFNLIIAYILYYYMVVKKLNLKNISFKQVSKNIKIYSENAKEYDLDVVKRLCDKNDIIHEKQLSEMVAYYRSKKTSTSFISVCISITSITLSLIPLFISGNQYESEYILAVVLSVILIVALSCFIFYNFYDLFIRSATKNEIYKTLEEYLSEILLEDVCFKN